MKSVLIDLFQKIDDLITKKLLNIVDYIRLNARCKIKNKIYYNYLINQSIIFIDV